MPVAGDPRLWAATFPPGLIPQVIALILESWRSFGHPGCREGEVAITRRFRSHLVTRKNRLRTSPVRIDRESVEDDFANARERGRIDIRFTHAHNCREDVYFAFECKRLNVRGRQGWRSLSDRYVSEGMMRFVTARYAPRLPHGGMLGYVLDGQVDAAIAAVGRSVYGARHSLRMIAPRRLSDSVLVPDLPVVKETFHRLRKRPFRIQHVFLGVA